MVAFSIQASKWVSEGDTENRGKKGCEKAHVTSIQSLTPLCNHLCKRQGEREKRRPSLTWTTARQHRPDLPKAHPALPHETWEGGVGG